MKVLAPDTVEVAGPCRKREGCGSRPVMEEGFYLYGATFHSAYVPVNKGVKLAVNIHPCFAESCLAFCYFASPLAETALHLSKPDSFIEEGFPNCRISGQVTCAGFSENAPSPAVQQPFFRRLSLEIFAFQKWLFQF